MSVARRQLWGSRRRSRGRFLSGKGFPRALAAFPSSTRGGGRAAVPASGRDVVIAREETRPGLRGLGLEERVRGGGVAVAPGRAGRGEPGSGPPARGGGAGAHLGGKPSPAGAHPPAFAPPGGRRLSPWVKETPTSPGAKCPRMPSSCKPAGKSTRRNTQILPSILPNSPRNVRRDGRPCLQRKSQSSKTWQKATKLAMTGR